MNSGSCLCKSVTYEVDCDIGEVVHCHCEKCRKAHGSAFSSVAAVGDKNFTLHSQAQLGSYESSPGKLRYFCSNCGSQIYAKRQGTEHVILRLGTLDTSSGAKETKHIWVSQKAEWYAINSTLAECLEYE